MDATDLSTLVIQIEIIDDNDLLSQGRYSKTIFGISNFASSYKMRRSYSDVRDQYKIPFGGSDVIMVIKSHINIFACSHNTEVIVTLGSRGHVWSKSKFGEIVVCPKLILI